MQQTRGGKKASNEGLLITFYKSVLSDGAKPKRKDFFIWGSSNFLYAEPIFSISQLSPPRSTAISGVKFDSVPLAENRYLYVYRDMDTNPFPNRELRWIFDPNLEDTPLIVITLLQSNNLHLIGATVRKKAGLSKFEFDIFNTLGHGKGVLVFRCKTYVHVLECLVQLNNLGESIYSIAGVQNPLASQKARRKAGILLFPKLLEASSSVPGGSTRVSVSINYMLKEGKKFKNRGADTFASILSMSQKIMNEFNIPEDELRAFTYYEIGRYDIEVRIEGCIVYVLELLMNPKYGLANIASDFYEKNIYESRTTWKIPASSKQR